MLCNYRRAGGRWHADSVPRRPRVLPSGGLFYGRARLARGTAFPDKVNPPRPQCVLSGWYLRLGQDALPKTVAPGREDGEEHYGKTLLRDSGMEKPRSLRGLHINVA